MPHILNTTKGWAHHLALPQPQELAREALVCCCLLQLVQAPSEVWP